MTKKNSVFKTIVVVLLLLFFVSAVASMFRGRTQTVVKTVNEQVESASGAFYLKLNGENELQVSEESEKTLLGGEKTETITLDGGVINVTGSNAGVIEAASGGTLTFKNTTIKDKTENNENAAYNNYIRFGGKLRFENCTIDSIYLKNDVQAEFVKCTFVSSVARWYSVWVADGSASFEGCTFTGYRGLKIHEFKGEDVLNVDVNDCAFEGLSEKPGIAIGEFLTDRTNGTVSVKGNRFIDCQPWDVIGSIEGVDGMYEADTHTSDFAFVQKDNVVEYTTNTRKIRYVMYEIGGDYQEIPKGFWKENGKYPTEYEVGEETEIDSLNWFADFDSGDLEFCGWYLDRACKVKFNGKLTSDTSDHITLYAKILTGGWTAFY